MRVEDSFTRGARRDGDRADRRVRRSSRLRRCGRHGSRGGRPGSESPRPSRHGGDPRYGLPVPSRSRGLSARVTPSDFRVCTPTPRHRSCIRGSRGDALTARIHALRRRARACAGAARLMQTRRLKDASLNTPKKRWRRRVRTGAKPGDLQGRSASPASHLRPIRGIHAGSFAARCLETADPTGRQTTSSFMMKVGVADAEIRAAAQVGVATVRIRPEPPSARSETVMRWS
jgi:hypothetical protein